MVLMLIWFGITFGMAGIAWRVMVLLPDEKEGKILRVLLRQRGRLAGGLHPGPLPGIRLRHRGDPG